MSSAMADDKPIFDTTKRYLLDEFMPGENPDALVGSTALMTGGVLNSISAVQLVGFLEQQFGVEFHAHEISPDYLDTLDDIVRTVRSKLDR